MNINDYLDQSYKQYLQAASKFSVDPVDRDEYGNLLFSAASALKDCRDETNEHPYVIVVVKDLYMKAKKVGKNLEVSYMDKETFNLTTKFKEDSCPTKQRSK